MSLKTPMSHVLSPLSLALVLLSGCAIGAPPPEDVQATLTIATVPPDVACLRVTATGPGRTVEREIAVSPGNTVNESFAGLPLGTVVFKGEAFSGDCEAVTKSTIPGWASEPETVAMVLGRQATISLTLNRNGRAKVNVDFNDEPTCTESGGTCLANAVCCSKSCNKGVCQSLDGGAGEDAR